MYISNPIVVIFLICLVLADQLEQQRSPDWDGLSLSQEEAVTDMLDNDSPRAAKEFLLFRQRHKGQPLSLLTVRYCWCTWWYGRCCCCTPPIPSTKTTYSTHFAPSFTSLVYLFLLFCFIKIIYRFCLEGGFLFFLFYWRCCDWYSPHSITHHAFTHVRTRRRRTRAYNSPFHYPICSHYFCHSFMTECINLHTRLFALYCHSLYLYTVTYLAYVLQSVLYNSLTLTIILYVYCMYCMCIVCVLCVYCTSTIIVVYVLYVYCMCTYVHVYCMYIVCVLHYVL